MEQVSVEKMVRDLLERAGVEDAQSFTSGDLVEIANIVAENLRLREEVARLRDLTTWRSIDSAPKDGTFVDVVVGSLDNPDYKVIQYDVVMNGGRWLGISTYLSDRVYPMWWKLTAKPPTNEGE